ncbi:peptide chain release factor H [Rurimicrobium arvi]|uniref:Peptide chain release factor H n=1 Tax=Rurimicrobium arvi TaxID=2049916 RepID=A0ABP8MIV7_9BACT
MQTMIVLVSAGRGPDECALAAARIAEKFEADATRHNIMAKTVEILKQGHGVRSQVFKVQGEGAEDFVQQWTGTLQWIASSPLRPYHKRKNWFVHIAAFREVELREWDERRVRIETCRSSGPGGQNVNKVETAVRATYLPTGLQVMVMDSRSQLQNKKAALERLRAKLLLAETQRESESRYGRWQEHDALQRGGATRIFREPL